MLGQLKKVFTPGVARSLLRRPVTYGLLGSYGRRHYARRGKASQGIWLDFTCRQMKAGMRREQLVVWSNAFGPFELFYGLGVIPCHPETLAALAARVGFSRISIDRAESDCYSADTCSFYRCAAGMNTQGLIPRPDIVVAASHLCDGSVKFFHNMSRYYGCDFYLLDMPYHDTEKSRRYLAGQLEELAVMIAGKQGRPLDPAGLSEALELSNTARDYALRVNDLRRRRPCPISGNDSLSYIVDMAFFGFGSRAGIEFFKALYEEAEAAAGNGAAPVPEEKYRLLWLHQVRPYYPNNIINHLEASGASVCCGESNHVYWQPLDTDDPFGSIAARMLSNPGGGPLERRAELAVALAEQYDVCGAIHFSHWGCRQSTGGEYVIRDVLRQHGIPMLILSGDAADSRNYSEEPTRLRLDAFLEMLEVRS